MRRLVACLVAAFVLATSSEALPLGCGSAMPRVAASHACCEGHGAAQRAARCCASPDARVLQGPAETPFHAPACGGATSISRAALDDSLTGRVVGRMPASPPVAFYLRQHVLLI